ncbi:MAG TPA: SUMF1/EgtB/PvdO family nonheme iron enzyme [Myxococcota bacterium]|nr:SUMF1/EgtB/PvdO family nonheme iron enzyme [Myxococcota bacterium]HRY93617.1 SUMF1/EgtB/PvdO family nonheme iron enzyme [Myxococcota bacterium]
MRLRAWPLVGLGLLLGVAAAAQDRPIVAVFDLEVKGTKLDKGTIDRLTDYLGSLMARKGFKVVPRSQLKERLTEAKKGTYKECYEESCQIEVGKELAAQKSLASQVLKIGKQCKVTVNLFDLKTAASDGAGAGSGDCDEDGVVKSLEDAVGDLFGGAGSSAAVDLPGPGGPAAPATDDKKAYRKELEKAWVGLAGAVRKLGPQEQLERYQAFLANYPVDNPYAGKVQKAVEGLEARLDKEAEAKRKAEEKAASLEAERQRAAELKKACDDLKALTGPAADQLEAWKKFLADYPDRNPYLSTAKRKVAELEARAKKEAALAAAEAKKAPTRSLVWVASRPAGIEFTKTEVTVEQYQACVKAGKCSAPVVLAGCNWSQPGREQHPEGCVDWNQATDFCTWAGGRLPTEQEWYAEASDNGKRQYPWGDEAVSCERAIWSHGGAGCGKDSTWPVCSKPAGNSVSGLCDMSGNAWEWTSSLQGSARVVRGGVLASDDPDMLRASGRAWFEPSAGRGLSGFRCARSAQ